LREELGAAGGAGEESDAELGFWVADGFGEGTLFDADSCRGAGEVEILCERHEIKRK